MDQYPSIIQFMAKKLVTFTPDTDIWKAIDIILKRKISGTPVVNEKHELIGMLSEVDCLKVLLQGSYDHAKPGSMGTVGDYMTAAVKTIEADKTVFDAAHIFVHKGYKRLPVVQDGKLVGQISRSDVLRAIQSLGANLRHIPDSWKGREPSEIKHKTTHYSKNA